MPASAWLCVPASACWLEPSLCECADHSLGGGDGADLGGGEISLGGPKVGVSQSSLCCACIPSALGGEGAKAMPQVAGGDGLGVANTACSVSEGAAMVASEQGGRGQLGVFDRGKPQSTVRTPCR